MRTFIILLLAMPPMTSGCAPKQPIPNPWYQCDGADINYMAPGPEFKLSREAAKQKAAAAENDASGKEADDTQKGLN